MADLITIMSLRELDALVAERVLEVEVLREVGNYYFATNNGGAWLPEYSRNIADAWILAEKIRIQLKPRGGHGWWAAINSLNWVEADTAPLAICLAALRSVGTEVDLKLGSDRS